MPDVFFLCIHLSNADIIYVGISKAGEGMGRLKIHSYPSLKHFKRVILRKKRKNSLKIQSPCT